jgi:hypothetical protein
VDPSTLQVALVDERGDVYGMYPGAVVAALKAHVYGNTERRHSQLLRRQQTRTFGQAGIVKLANDHIQIHKDMLAFEMPQVTVTATVVMFARSMRDAPAYHATHLALLNPAIRPKTFNDLIQLAENIEEHKPQDQAHSLSQAMAASSRWISAGRAVALPAVKVRVAIVLAGADVRFDLARPPMTGRGAASRY